MISPGSITNSVPDPDEAVRLQRDTQRIAQENISSVAASFQTTVNALNAQVAAIAAVVNAQVTATTGHSSASGYALNTGAQELTRATITVPAGYTQALVFGTASMTVLNQSGTGGDAIRGYIDINGVAGAVSGGAIVDVVHTVSVTVSYSRLITGLTGGSTFYVRCVYYNEAGMTGATSARNICNLDATVTFLH